MKNTCYVIGEMKKDEWYGIDFIPDWEEEVQK